MTQLIGRDAAIAALRAAGAGAKAIAAIENLEPLVPHVIIDISAGGCDPTDVFSSHPIEMTSIDFNGDSDEYVLEGDGEAAISRLPVLTDPSRVQAILDQIEDEVARCVRCGNTDNDGSDGCVDCGDRME